ncbi:hypothetical protein N181_18390 [Sinorhizobium fredii USDA 205]|nr:hypothetical protein N181_18390 [Sinorhizobium fredii USDA 205]GEC32023.1 hypothetical protein EFR01_21940 [Sinorhizobium fredii]GLS08064.1 hypothetical protein GCM10007864_16920 [Sinorhizobium fredii]
MQYPLDLKLDPEDIEHRGILRDDDVRLIRSRVGILLSIYFADGWSQEKREALITCLGDYLSFFSSEVTHFQVDDEPKMRAYKEGGVPDEYRRLLDLPETDSLFVYLKQADTAEPWDPSRLMFMGFGHRKSKVWPSSGIEVHFSPRFVFENTDRFVGLVPQLVAAARSCSWLMRPGRSVGPRLRELGRRLLLSLADAVSRAGIRRDGELLDRNPKRRFRTAALVQLVDNPR